MRNRIQFKEPVVVYSAVQLASMPLSQMQQCLSAQEAIAGKEATIGVEAFQCLLKLRDGSSLEWERPKKRTLYFIDGKPADLVPLKQLARRGYFELPT